MICPQEGTPRPAPNEVEQAVQKRLHASPHAALRKLSCYLHFEQGVLYLRGRLSNCYEQQLAQEWIAGIESVVQVVNETEVVACPI